MQSIINNMPERVIYCVGGQTLEIGYPWLTTGAIIALELLLNNTQNILEIGMGGSTIFYSRRCKYITSIDTNKDWYSKTCNRLAELEIKNYKAVLMSGTSEIVNFIKHFDDNYFDLISVDPDPSTTDRLTVANAVISKVKSDGWLLLDNYGTFKNFNLDWKSFTYDDFDWSGNGTKLFKKPT